MKTHMPLVLATCVVSSVPLLHAQQTEKTTGQTDSNLWTRDRLGGDLFGARPALAEHGVDIR